MHLISSCPFALSPDKTLIHGQQWSPPSALFCCEWHGVIWPRQVWFGPVQCSVPQCNVQQCSNLWISVYAGCPVCFGDWKRCGWWTKHGEMCLGVWDTSHAYLCYNKIRILKLFPFFLQLFMTSWKKECKNVCNSAPCVLWVWEGHCQHCVHLVCLKVAVWAHPVGHFQWSQGRQQAPAQAYLPGTGDTVIGSHCTCVLFRHLLLELGRPLFHFFYPFAYHYFLLRYN